MSLSERLPVFPWDRLAPFGDIARNHPDGIVDLSVGTPVDPVPPLIRRALQSAADIPGYPLTAGTPELRAALRDWLALHCGADASVGVLPTIGSKELVGWLPTLLGAGPGDTVVLPRLAYPTYDIGVRVSGAEALVADSPSEIPSGTRPSLIWINSPSNPTGRVSTAGELRDWLAYARETGAVLAGDECYLTLGWDAEPVSVLSVCDGDYGGVLSVHSLSKRSNLAGYRAGFVGGDPALVASLLEARKHTGMIVPAPVQAAMVAALGDEEHAAAQRELYRARREVLRPALLARGMRVEHSEAGLYLWATRDEDCWKTVEEFASLGVLVAPGEFYGVAGGDHVRVALTAPDALVASAAARLAG
ncbi:succinyldiaminopimelate transaminase [Phytomonospora sp. NPDC050363]|uniref:succinyldiaminopimelate transaminase n=1 Tax=Phytomonospora sp. NPDC050363 TaxID=3155642 RepID=UPI0033F13503